MSHTPTVTGDNIAADNAGWSFEGTVAETFDAHVSKSVPLYDVGHDLVAKISDFFLTRGSLCYELGCSTGALVERVAQRCEGRGVRFIAIDSVAEMIRKASVRCKDLKNVSVEVADLVDFDLEDCDMIISYYTMQFVRPRFRQDVIRRVYESLNWGGAFVLFEKVRGPDARFQDIATALYTEYKVDQGYNSEEILAKTRSLKGVMEPFSTRGNLDLMHRAGFVDVTTVMKYVCFEGFLAIK